MKHLLYFVSALLLPLFATAQGYELEYKFRPYAVLSSRIMNLERSEAAMGGAGSGFTNAKARIFFMVQGGESPVRFSKDNLPGFVIQLERGVDPEDVIKLVRGTSRKGTRKFSFSETRISAWGSNRDNFKGNSDQVVPVAIRRLDEDVFEITLAAGLEPGEYAFMPIVDPNGSRVFSATVRLCSFGID